MHKTVFMSELNQTLFGMRSKMTSKDLYYEIPTFFLRIERECSKGSSNLFFFCMLFSRFSYINSVPPCNS